MTSTLLQHFRKFLLSLPRGDCPAYSVAASSNPERVKFTEMRDTGAYSATNRERR
jgi:hypothetical protein